MLTFCNYYGDVLHHANDHRWKGRGKLQADFTCICDGYAGADCSGRSFLFERAVAAIFGILALLLAIVMAFDYRILFKLRQEEHERYVKFCEQHPITVKTLAGSVYTLVDWAVCADLRELLVAQHPVLGDWKHFVLQDANIDSVTGGGTMDPKKGSSDRFVCLLGCG